ncbi:MAG: alpha/beta hydrolase, partial [Atopobiaceae bacterium]
PEATAALYEQADPVTREFLTYYCTARGRTPNCTGQITLNSIAALMGFFPFANIDLLAGRPQLYVMGADAHSREFTEDAFAAAPEPKELLVIDDCDHVDLYDNKERIPFAKLAEFFGKALGE